VNEVPGEYLTDWYIGVDVEGAYNLNGVSLLDININSYTGILASGFDKIKSQYFTPGSMG